MTNKKLSTHIIEATFKAITYPDFNANVELVKKTIGNSGIETSFKRDANHDHIVFFYFYSARAASNAIQKLSVLNTNIKFQLSETDSNKLLE